MVIAMGSVLGTIKDTVDEMRAEGHKIGVLGIISYRPFPLEQVREALLNCKRFVVLEKSLAVGMGGIVATDVRMAVTGSGLKGYTAIAGLGGRPITRATLHKLFLKAEQELLPPVTFVDLDWEAVNKQLTREQQTRRSGPAAENMLHDKGLISAKFG
jgi:pyruvate ferredoxin oxidoreductase alpha subunit